MKTEFSLYDPVTGLGQVAFPYELARKEKCKYCELQIDVNVMDNHIRGVHGRFFNDKEKISCSLCGKRVKKVGMKAHLRKVHGA